jgi:hypothetical protein
MNDKPKVQNLIILLTLLSIASARHALLLCELCPCERPPMKRPYGMAGGFLPSYYPLGHPTPYASDLNGLHALQTQDVLEAAGGAVEDDVGVEQRVGEEEEETRLRLAARLLQVNCGEFHDQGDNVKN